MACTQAELEQQSSQTTSPGHYAPSDCFKKLIAASSHAAPPDHTPGGFSHALLRSCSQLQLSVSPQITSGLPAYLQFPPCTRTAIRPLSSPPVVSINFHPEFICASVRPYNRRSDRHSDTTRMSAPDPVAELVEALRRALNPAATTSASAAATSAFAAASPSPPVIASPVAAPAPFSGSVGDCNGFLLQCSLALEMQPQLYPDDKAKVAFIISRLEGKALRWAEPLWTQHHPAVTSLSSFLEHFREVFGTPAGDSSIGPESQHPAASRCVRGLHRAGKVHPAFHQGRHPYAAVPRGAPGPVAAPSCTPPVRACQVPRTSRRAHGSGTLRRRNHRVAAGAAEEAGPESLSLLRPFGAFHSGIPHPPGTISARALLDSGSAGNFISGALCRQLRLKLTATQKAYQIHAVTGRTLQTVHHLAGPLSLQVGALHCEELHLLVLENATTDIILGRPWLELHDPVLSGKGTGEILKWGEHCFGACFPNLPAPSPPQVHHLPAQATSVESPPEACPPDIPACYSHFGDVFCPRKASKLPPHRPGGLCYRPHSR
ncbi:hypothetical protein QTP70_004137 [Hemibagrus guttatus]|uniref:DUF4939 domain-containing protein n=1 Tax=Hemibagrus guttatus TaxID=175788 RepID=A0AAE0PPU0_9TELE|nr:hypothetical protein QTP70_004137 [Hemibagrus guttatus]